MKKILYCLGALLMALHTYAQNAPLADGVKKTSLPIVYLPANVSVHFISPEPIQYVDISTNHIVGDLPLKNVLRIKQISDTSRIKILPDEDAVVTIAGEKFIAQYHIVFANEITARDTRTDIEILPADTRPLDIAGIGLSQPQLQKLAFGLISKNAGKPKEHTKANGITGTVNHLYTLGDYVFIDVSYQNHTRLKYEVDDFKFKVDDKKVVKATNEQSVSLLPVFSLLQEPAFEKNYRNIFVIKKLTFPDNKVLHIELNEKQFSGRVITLDISYKDVLQADILPQ
jgi:conjugative transposon TraN protein